MKIAASLAAAAALVAAVAHADVLYSNGGFVTNPTGGTGSIAGLPISNSDGFNVPGSTFLFSTTGAGATVLSNTSLADDFTVPAGGWQLDTVTLYAFQTSQSAPSVTSIRINLWDATPFSAGSPDNVPDPLPTPLLATPLTLAAGPGTFVCHRQSPTGTGTVRPVFAYTVSLAGLPNGGRLAGGRYWLEWSFQGATSPSVNVFTPLVTPRSSRTSFNARQFNAIDNQPTSPRVWFEGREGFVANVTPGRAFELPFVLSGSAITCDADINQDGNADQGDVDTLIDVVAGGANPDGFNPDFNSDGNTDQGDIDALVNVLAGGECP